MSALLLNPTLCIESVALTTVKILMEFCRLRCNGLLWASNHRKFVIRYRSSYCHFASILNVFEKNFFYLKSQNLWWREIDMFLRFCEELHKVWGVMSALKMRFTSFIFTHCLWVSLTRPEAELSLLLTLNFVLTLVIISMEISIMSGEIDICPLCIFFFIFMYGN